MLKQDKHRHIVREEVTRRGLVSAMNKTKWLEFANAMYQELAFPPAYSRKDVLDKDYTPLEDDAWYLGDYEGLQPYYSIEWIEVKPKVTKSRGLLMTNEVESIENEFIAVLRKYNIPYEHKNGSYFIYGYASDFSNIVLA
ncbi:DUF6678 family protein [Vibrio nigripulchritudo]|uniref:DUF6678 family protein n=1 Tax=Vibrio nigripulchritudo TaxID=28173 RepID=UPI0005FA0CDB|nr:DUF6678 family protein [Vibrio nigripulchritudo]KJY66348.1 hypothetical protein TW74_28110 [Vibrio nigripulchritudo]